MKLQTTIFTLILALVLPRLLAAEKSFVSHYNLQDVPTVFSKAYPIDLTPEEDGMELAQLTIPNHMECPQSLLALSSTDPESRVVLNLSTSEYGQVEALLEENDADSATEIVLTGPMDASDFKALWNCAVIGNLQVLDLKGAQIKDNTVPDRALYNSVQFEVGHWLGIRKIILPDDVVKIGTAAFPLMRLEEINIPKSLKELGSTAFAYDYWLNCPIELPEGVEEIKFQTFIDCRSLECSPILPSTLKKIGSHAFANTPFQHIDFNDGLQSIEVGAFQCCGLKEVRFPDSVTEIGHMAFQISNNMEHITFPTGIEEIPFGVFSYCNGLREVTIPDGVKVIANSAFMWCTILKEVTIPDSVESIEQDAFDGCLFETLVLPSSLGYLGSSSFSILGMKDVYCKAKVPPLCESEPFPPFPPAWISGTLLYVPIGSKNLYESQWEWNLFQDIIETDDFSGVKDCLSDEGDGEGAIYDLYGRKVTNPLPNQIYIKNGKKVYIH